jgi:hypothetical protein
VPKAPDRDTAPRAIPLAQLLFPYLDLPSRREPPLAHSLLYYRAIRLADGGCGMKQWWCLGRFLGAAALVIVLCGAPRAQTWTSETSQSAAPNPDDVTSFGLVPSPLPSWFESDSAATINQWIAQRDIKSITLHAWKLWGAVTSLTRQKFRGAAAPVFLTWWPQGDVFATPEQSAALRSEPARVHFELPRQFARFQHLLAETTTPQPLPGNQNVVVTVQYNGPMFRHVQKNQYYDPNTLQNINDNWSSATPIAAENLAPFPANSVMTKPSYLLAYANQPTQMQYWTGPADSITQSTPGYGTWTNWMWVLPPGMNVQQFEQTQADGHPVVSVNDFYHFRLTPEDFQPSSPLEGAILFPNNPLTGSGFNPGDYALLVAMHVSSHEISDWTWQTFFWSLAPVPIPASVRPMVKPPFNHYVAEVGYSFTDDGTASSLPTLCYNPYLEAGFDNSVFSLPGQLGIESNCMSCHRAAVWPAIAPASAPAGTINPGYVANGLIDPGNAYLFGGQTKTDFVWGVQNNVAPPATSP